MFFCDILYTSVKKNMLGRNTAWCEIINWAISNDWLWTVCNCVLTVLEKMIVFSSSVLPLHYFMRLNKQMNQTKSVVPGCGGRVSAWWWCFQSPWVQCSQVGTGLLPGISWIIHSTIVWVALTCWQVHWRGGSGGGGGGRGGSDPFTTCDKCLASPVWSVCVRVCVCVSAVYPQCRQLLAQRPSTWAETGSLSQVRVS